MGASRVRRCQVPWPYCHSFSGCTVDRQASLQLQYGRDVPSASGAMQHSQSVVEALATVEAMAPCGLHPTLVLAVRPLTNTTNTVVNPHGANDPPTACRRGRSRACWHCRQLTGSDARPPQVQASVGCRRVGTMAPWVALRRGDGASSATVVGTAQTGTLSDRCDRASCHVGQPQRQ